MLFWSRGESLKKSSGCLDWYLWGNHWAETTELPSDKECWPLHATAWGTSVAELWCLTGCSDVFQTMLRVRVTVVFSSGRGKYGQLLPCKPVVGTSRSWVWFSAEVCVVSTVQLRAWTVGEGDLLQALCLGVICAEQENHHPLQKLQGGRNSSWARRNVRTDGFVAFVAELVCLRAEHNRKA